MISDINTKLLIAMDIIKSYPPNVTAVNHISLSVDRGEFVFITGKSGAGKTTLIRLLSKQEEPDNGKLFISGKEITTIPKSKGYLVRRELGVVFQDFKLLSDRSVKENLLFVLKATGWTEKEEMEVKIEEVLDKVGMKGFAFKMPHQLSGGEQQRVGIARALLNDPEIILADEPTGNLDPQTSVEVMEVLRKINANGKTILMATHDYALVLKYPSKTLKFEGGKMFEVVQRTV